MKRLKSVFGDDVQPKVIVFDGELSLMKAICVIFSGFYCSFVYVKHREKCIVELSISLQW